MLTLIRKTIAGPAAGPILGVIVAGYVALAAVIFAQRVQTGVLHGEVASLAKKLGAEQVNVAMADASIVVLRGTINDQNEAIRKIADDCRASTADAAARSVAAWQAARKRQLASNIGAGPEEMNRWLASSP